MQVNITFRHLEPTEALKDHVRTRVEHVERYVDRPSEAHAVLHVEHLHHHAEITVKAGKFLLRGTAKSEDMYASIDAAAERIERQLKKHKEKLTSRKTSATPLPLSLPPPVDIRHDVLDVLENPDRPSHRVVKSKRFEARPMSVDDAILQMELIDLTFFVFLNEQTHGVNVVYKRDDGTLGLLEASTAAANGAYRRAAGDHA